MTATPIPVGTRGPGPHPARDTRWIALAVIAVSQLMVALDTTIVSIALPSAQADLGFSDTERTWVITAYTCALAGLLLLGGRIADRIGRRRALLLGLAGFAAASALAGFAGNLAVLAAGRALQGGFAAILAPTALALVATTFTEPQERAKAFGVYGAVAASGAMAGLLLGGLLADVAGWRWCLFINIPVALAAGLAGRAVFPSADGHPDIRVDLVSAALVTAGLSGVVLGCARAAVDGWASPLVLVPGLGGLLLVGGFLLRQRRDRDGALLPLWLLAHPARAGANAAIAVAVVGSFGMFLLLTYHLQVVLGWSTMQAGLAFLPMTVAAAGSSYGLGTLLLPRVAPRQLIVPGLAAAAAGLGWLTTLTPDSGYATVVLPAELLVGVGMGLVFTPAVSVATARIPIRYAGVAAATANTSMQIGGSLGTAILNSVAVAATATYVAARPGAAARDALVHGYATATGWAAAALAVTAIAGWFLIRTPAPDPAGSERGDR